jgi:hypothetical protein
MMITKIMIVRHAEKPDDSGAINGISPQGTPDPEDLTPRGWQRAGALARFFAPRDGSFADPDLASPDVIYASQVGHHSPSARPQHTVTPLADLLGKPINLDHPKGDETGLVTAVLASTGVALIAWQHEAIPAIARLILDNTLAVPAVWPDDRFDLVWILTRQGQAWSFRQVPQLLLPGDEDSVIVPGAPL